MVIVSEVIRLHPQLSTLSFFEKTFVCENFSQEVLARFGC